MQVYQHLHLSISFRQGLLSHLLAPRPSHFKGEVAAQSIEFILAFLFEYSTDLRASFGNASTNASMFIVFCDPVVYVGGGNVAGVCSIWRPSAKCAAAVIP